MSRVAVVGFAPNTLDQVRRSPADEIWSLVWAYKYDQFPRIDRLFEMHPIWQQAGSDKPEYVKPRTHWAWLKTNNRLPVYMLEQRPEVPRSRRYPIEQVEAMLAGWTRSGETGRMFTSSIDYMLALAILEGFDEIELIGVEMSSGSEFKYQREGLAFWVGFAQGRGIRVIQHAPTLLLHRPRRYGYDGFQMIYRQDLERLQKSYADQLAASQARLQFLEGVVSTLQESLILLADPGDHANLSATLDERTAAMLAERDRLAIASGALQAVEYLIREIDLEEPNPDELVNQFASILHEVA